MKIITDNNLILDATISVETLDNNIGITFNSRGGAKKLNKLKKY